MSVVEGLIQKLSKHDLQWSRVPEGVRIEALDEHGFAVRVYEHSGGSVVYLGEGGFHEEFDDDSKAMNFIAWCYSGEARLKEIWRGKVMQKAILEAYVDGNWRSESEIGFFLVPFWRSRRERLLCNPNLLRTHETAGDGFPPSRE